MWDFHTPNHLPQGFKIWRVGTLPIIWFGSIVDQFIGTSHTKTAMLLHAPDEFVSIWVGTW